VDNSYFEEMLSRAVAESHERQLRGFDNEDEHVFSDEHNRKMSKLFAYDKRRDVAKAVAKYTYRVAAVICIVFALAVTLLMTNGDARALFSNTIVEILDGYTGVHFPNEPVDDYIEWYPTKIPNGYKVTYRSYASAYSEVEYSKNGVLLQFIAAQAAGSQITVDNEHTEMKTLEVKGITYTIFESVHPDFPTMLLWERAGYAFFLSGFESVDNLIKIAGSVRQS
jgi:hypothetical protein